MMDWFFDQWWTAVLCGLLTVGVITWLKYLTDARAAYPKMSKKRKIAELEEELTETERERILYRDRWLECYGEANSLRLLQQDCAEGWWQEAESAYAQLECYRQAATWWSQRCKDESDHCDKLFVKYNRLKRRGKK